MKHRSPPQIKQMQKVQPAAEISATVPDWSREACIRFWDPSCQLLNTIRRYQTWRSRKGILSVLFCKFYVFLHRFWSVVAGSDIPITCQLGGGLLLPHPIGVVIHPDAQVGPNCLILQQVTITGDVIVGGHVDIGSGAKLIRGGITVGDHAKIGANAVVLCDVPPGATAVGVPAKIILPKTADVPYHKEQSEDSLGTIAAEKVEMKTSNAVVSEAKSL